MKKNLPELGTLLLLLGISAWVPFLLLVFRGAEPSIYPFLAVHLVGVIGGSRLRAAGRPAGKRRSRRLVWGRLLILLGVFAWAPYLYQTEVLGRELEITPYLAAHLTGVLSGFALLLSGPLLHLGRRLHASLRQTALPSRHKEESV